MRRTFVNLFDNAIHAMEKKGNIWVSTEVDWKLQRVIVKVADEGPGIRHKDREKLFMPYFSKRRAGTGLGLAIVRKIMEDHLGHLTLGDAPGGGALVSLELPSGVTATEIEEASLSKKSMDEEEVNHGT